MNRANGMTTSFPISTKTVILDNFWKEMAHMQIYLFKIDLLQTMVSHHDEPESIPLIWLRHGDMGAS